MPARQVQAQVKDFLAESLDAQKNPVIQRIRADEALKGELRGVAQALLVTLSTRGVAVDELSRRRILTCQDLPTLQRWMIRAITAPTIADIFG